MLSSLHKVVAQENAIITQDSCWSCSKESGATDAGHVFKVLCKAYIDFEISQEEFQKTRDLYERLLERTQHVKVWISYAQFELTTDLDDRISQTRNVYGRANRELKTAEDKEERLMLLESWKQFETTSGDEESLELVQKKMPRKVKKRRKIETDDGSDAGWEEFYDYIFPDDEDNLPNFKLLQMARLWKQNKAQE
ncbi:crooked neck 1 [Paramuricea clavata]|uniref:Crooked neck 1 n=1 Tax=Paramuricea clavata TaxID=317549 RepID=A0A6S7KAH2_PARCT|nr:crooked neck 1 [Paramuricea clavata]